MIFRRRTIWFAATEGVMRPIKYVDDPIWSVLVVRTMCGVWGELW
jgi:hypothetical protein